MKTWVFAALIPVSLAACKKDDKNKDGDSPQSTTLMVENVLKSQPLVESGTFQGNGTPALIFPGQSTTITFSAAKGEALSFATMYGWSNDLFFAPANPGIKVYDNDGNPIEGDVSAQVKLWDNGTRINQKPGATVNHPGTADNKNITEVTGADAQGNTYLEASKLVKATLKYNGNSQFTLTLQNTSGGTTNETPLSPGVWSVSYIVGGNLLAPTPLYESGKPTANGLTNIAEAGDNVALSAYVKSITGIFTPLSPVLAVVYNGIENPIYKVGEKDRGKGLTLIAQQGNAATLAAYLKTFPGVKAVYVLPAPTTTVLLPQVGNTPGGIVSQELSVSKGDRLAIATMYGFSNDWFFSSVDNGVDATQKGDISGSIKLFDDGTAINQFPGAGLTQFNLAGTPLKEDQPIAAVPNPNAFTTLPEISNIIKVTLK
ncbi:spondin domain-containing protein [Mucilaginibacter sabulilitoris]|uniref:Spondin domain-containing protein n=1 Tax=Mucilaginibacter sabulilitoris TaxID=1173583 RepID=A0ABZ0TSM0_9SPHI|nr:spondin domain-containing protein [Mucilaginibacter sabulilitoris]WPU94759.1 spondin domain-containing protein [Mucilaginibacter sabulilitoris]